MFDELFDFNQDGEIDEFEFRIGMSFLEAGHEADQRDEPEEEEGFDYYELEILMDD